MEKTKYYKSEFINGDHLKVWFQTQTYNGKITIAYKEGTELIKKDDLIKAEELGFKSKCEKKWKVVKDNKK